jgi:hypothetical protein
MYAIGGFLL